MRDDTTPCGGGPYDLMTANEGLESPRNRPSGALGTSHPDKDSVYNPNRPGEAGHNEDLGFG